MEIQAVNSSNINGIGYDKEYFILRVAFANGNIYDYSPVTEEKYLSFMNAESKGKFFNQHIKEDTGLTVVKIAPIDKTFSVSDILNAEKKQKESEAVKNRETKPLTIPKIKDHAQTQAE